MKEKSFHNVEKPRRDGPVVGFTNEAALIVDADEVNISFQSDELRHIFAADLLMI